MEIKKDKERKIMSRTVDVNISRKTKKPYLTTLSKDDKRYFVNLVKDNKRFTPTIPEGTKQIEVSFTSYLYDDENRTLVLFGVDDLNFNR